MPENERNGFVVTMFAVSLSAFLLGLVPYVSWVLLIAGTVLHLVALIKEEKGGFMTASLVLLTLAWTWKGMVYLFFKGLF
ncbi:hypothetical protein IMZ31_23705 (plasmid) [Pontibacillus sp. ALD_SL1]|uniref:hypothetical protein n=1 Tax=Pontibacillus sp. ALD_SL1 TaxID=2777185 RepID=UPI001A971489|nr:hypothetical protein [Pontibacillus sp. ALD_SL1]QST02458.1 hypothetical protein IMZ31_23705 [Pontibacillus sp. ALD_SL1]